jgi:glyoxylase-like metal-dependent hydrolase (beta-lactamase superfamily II)
VTIERLAANLWRWTAPSPHWTPKTGHGPDAWDRGEVAYWLPEHGVLVAAEVLQGTADGLRFAESPAIADSEALHAWLRDLDRLPVRVVLPTHGPPAPDGRAAIRAALARPPYGSGSA